MFNNPLNVRWRMFLPELVSCIKQSILSKFKGTGALARSFTLGQLKAFKNGDSEGVNITNPLPYAAIQDTGGDIPVRYVKRAMALHWVSNGTDVFAKSARGFHLEGKNYIQDALNNWVNNGIDVEWQ
jgi:hypothetical protein